MAIYRISGRLPAPWEDFYPVDNNKHPKITIKRARYENIEVSDEEGEEGWIDVSLTDFMITKDIALKVLKFITDEEDIELIEDGIFQSIQLLNMRCYMQQDYQLMRFKPVNWSGVIDARKSNKTERNSIIFDAYQRGEKLRLDQKGLMMVANHQIIPIECIAIDRRKSRR